MQTVNIHEAKTHLSKLLVQVEAGQSFVIAKAGKPIAQVIPLSDQGQPKKRRLGMLADQFKVPDDIKTPFKDEIEEMFYGKPDKFA
jgi:prevent-host-death family protein